MRVVRILASLLLIAGDANAAENLSRFARFEPGSAVTVDSSDYGAFLAKHLRAQTGDANLFDYGAAAADKPALKGYIAKLETVDPTALSRDEAFAYWVNLYNALTVMVVLDHYPVSSIRKIKSGPISFGPWDKKLATVSGVALSLNDIEHKILRAHFGDNRVHYAVNCASIGCPNLKPTPWTAASLDADLDAAARAFINSPRGVAIVDGKLTASSIFDWYRNDFGKTDKEVLAHFAKYADAPLAADLAHAAKIDAYRYDWTLNDAAARRPR